jgi:hypothetical protein
MITATLVAFAFQVTPAPPPPADSVNLLRRAARRAEAAFERIARQRAPLTFASYGGRCDEIVGRFCLTYDSRDLPEPAPEAEPVVLARRQAIEALRQAFSYAPESFEVTGPLVRYLVEDERAGEAVSAARAYLALSNDTTWGALLLGFALHAAAEDTAATRWLELGVSRLPERERAHIENVSWLLAHDENREYRRLDDELRRSYHDAYWTLSNPLFLLPGNDRRNEHLARHVWSRILARAPVVVDAVRWGSDLEQLTVRYGTPRSRQRAMGPRPGESTMIERYDAANLPYTPERLQRAGLPTTPEPGEAWELENPRARSGYSSVALRQLQPLDHQLTRFPDGDEVVIRVDAAVVLDTVAAAAHDTVPADARTVRAGLFLLDSLYSFVHGETREYPATGDTIRTHFRAIVAPGRYVYSAEAFEPATRLGARARYAVDAERMDGVRLSDILVSEPFSGDSLPRTREDGQLRPLASLTVDATDTIGIYAEASGLAAGPDGRARYRVEVTRLRERGSLPGEVVAWLGRRLGIGGDRTQPRVAWTAEGWPDVINPIAIDLSFPGARSGLYVLELTVADLVSGRRQSTLRPVRVR